MSGRLRLLVLSARVLAGRRYWLAALLPLGWLLLQAIFLLTGTRQTGFVPASAQNTLIGGPLIALAIGLGVRIIAGELDARTLELAYTVPGGARLVWLSKLAAATTLLLSAEVLLALATFALFTPYPPGALLGALQAALFYLVLAMALAALFRGQAAGAMATVAILALNLFLTGFGNNQSRLSPLFNPVALQAAEATQLFAWTVQNRLGFVLAIAAVAALAFLRADRREKLLAG